MVRITENLVRKRAEHNECEIYTLEELSLHQQDIEKIENLDRWCKDLKILYLQSNLIGKIENVGRLKKLEYLNLALNNIERVENLQNCESLKKLDLTVNFIGEITSLESLKCNEFLVEMYLTGNPCVNYEGYREYVIALLPQLQYLDGLQIEKSERIKANQKFAMYKQKIIQQQCEYMNKRRQEKEEFKSSNGNEDDENKGDEHDSEYWNEKVGYTPESRTEIQNKIRENKEKKTKPMFEKPDYKRKIRFFNDDGEPMNVNEAKVDFNLTESEDDSEFILDVACHKYMDTSLIDADVQPHYVRVTMKGQALQLVLFEEVKPDSSTAKRSEVTGHLLLTMPKLNPPEKPVVKKTVQPNLEKNGQENTKPTNKNKKRELLEVNDKKSFKQNLADITKKPPLAANIAISNHMKSVSLRENDKDFVDNSDVPALI